MKDLLVSNQRFESQAFSGAEALKLETVLQKALDTFEELETLDERLRGSYMYPKKVRTEMQEQILKELEEKNEEYLKLKTEYETLFDEINKPKQNPVIVNE